MSKLIALVPIAVLIDGVRTKIEPGEDVPADTLSAHDLMELKSMGSIKDEDEEAAVAKKQARAEVAAGADFERERKAIAAANASTAPPAAAKKK